MKESQFTAKTCKVLYCIEQRTGREQLENGQRMVSGGYEPV